jgi:hypothetical protein
MFCTGVETAVVQGFNKIEYIGLKKDCLTSDDFLESIEPELEEIAIEMSDSWVPSPHVRLLMKVSTAILNFHEMKQQKLYQDEIEKKSSYWRFEFYQKYFDVNTTDVLYR